MVAWNGVTTVRKDPAFSDLVQYVKRLERKVEELERAVKALSKEQNA